MPKLDKKIGGEAFHVGDCYIWAAIYYLDSPTDYREYITQNGFCTCTISADLVMLDSSIDLTSTKTRSLVILALTILIGALLWHFVG